MFDDDKPKYGNLIRQALLTHNDYTLTVGDYHTLCVNDANEGGSTPSIKKLFSDPKYSDKVKWLLDSLQSDSGFKQQLEKIVSNSSVPQDEWRYCLIKYPKIFNYMSESHLRLRTIPDKRTLIIRNKLSSGYNTDLYLTALQEKIKSEHINVGKVEQKPEDQGINAKIVLNIGKEHYFLFEDNKFALYSNNHKIEEFYGPTLIDDAAKYLIENASKMN